MTTRRRPAKSNVGKRIILPSYTKLELLDLIQQEFPISFGGAWRPIGCKTRSGARVTLDRAFRKLGVSRVTARDIARYGLRSRPRREPFPLRCLRVACLTLTSEAWTELGSKTGRFGRRRWGAARRRWIAQADRNQPSWIRYALEQIADLP